MRIALTGSGTATSTGFFRAVRMAFADDVELIGLDINPMNSCMPFVDLSLRVPQSDDKMYPPYLADLCSKLEIDLLLPILDSEFITLHENRHLFHGPLFMPDYAPTMTDKRLCADLLKKAGCPTPAIREAYDGKRLIWKPRIGAGGRGVRIVDSQADVPEGDGLLFDFVDGREYTVDFLAYKGALVCAAQRERLMTRGGVCTIATVDPLGEAVERGLTAIIDTVGYDGPGCFQFISNRDTGMWWTDLNPRVGGGTGMTVEAGLNIPAMFLDILQGAEPMDVPPVMPCHVVRYFTEILV